jgi:hypothetical protein
VQLLAPLLSALAFGRPTLAALACAALALALFMAHEPLVVLLGWRGATFRAAHMHAARVHLLARMALATFLGLVLLAMVPEVRWPLVLVAVLNVAALAALLRKREKSLLSDLLAGAALTSFVIPVLYAQRVHPVTGATFVGGWLAIQMLATLTARAFVYRRRDGMLPLRLATIGGALMLGLALWLVVQAQLPLAVCLALSPFALLAAALNLDACRPRSPKTLGWSMTLANAGAVVLLGMTLVHTL